MNDFDSIDHQPTADPANAHARAEPLHAPAEVAPVPARAAPAPAEDAHEPAQAASPAPESAPAIVETTPEPPAPQHAETGHVAPVEPAAAASADAVADESARPVAAETAAPVAAETAAPVALESGSAVAVESPAAGAATPPAAVPVDAAALEAQKAANAARTEERRVRAQQAWERVVNGHANGETLTGTVTSAVKGGLLVDIAGIRGFLPASQARVPLGTAIETLVKTKIPLKVIDIDNARRRVVVSHRRAADDQRRAMRAELLASLKVGETREGVVVRLADFGAFVDLGGIDGLIPMRELAFERVEKVQDVLTVGDRLPVVVLRIEENGKKISLSRKNALPDPWRDHADVLRRDTTVHGKVVGKEPRLQVELAPGIVGTVRESDANPADYELGEDIEVAVRSVDRATRRISLTTMHGAAAVVQQQSTSSSGFAPLGVELSSRPKRR
ncbi:MAG: hypothetical protein NVS3B7_05760 [Candidatus Elarobacter sp.]